MGIPQNWKKISFKSGGGLWTLKVKIERIGASMTRRDFKKGEDKIKVEEGEKKLDTSSAWSQPVLDSATLLLTANIYRCRERVIDVCNPPESIGPCVAKLATHKGSRQLITRVK